MGMEVHVPRLDMKFDGTIKGPISEDAILRALGGQRDPGQPPAGPPPPPIDEDPPFVVHNHTRQVHDDGKRRRRVLEVEEGYEDRFHSGWVSLGTLIGIAILIILLGILVTRKPQEVPVDNDGRVRVVVVPNDGVAETEPRIVNDVDITINGERVCATSSTLGVRHQPHAPRNHQACPRDTLGVK